METQTLAVVFLALVGYSLGAVEEQGALRRASLLSQNLEAELPPAGKVLFRQTTTPPPEKSATSILTSIKEAITAQLHGKKQYNINEQYIDATIAAIFGLLLLSQGELVFKWLVIGAMFLLALVLALNEVSAAWGLEDGSKLRLFMGLEAGAFAACISFKGYQGVLLLLSAGLGGVIARGLEHGIAHFYPPFTAHKWGVVALYSVFVLGTALLVRLKKHTKILALVSAIAGGALVSSVISWGVAVAAANGQIDWIYTMMPGLQTSQVSPAWIDFLKLLLLNKSEDVGILAGSTKYETTVLGEKWSLNRIVGVCMWALLAMLGAALQVRRINKARLAAKKEAQKKARKGTTTWGSCSEPVVAKR